MGKRYALQVNIKGFHNPENEEQIDQSKNLWVEVPGEWFNHVRDLINNCENCDGFDDITDSMSEPNWKDNGVDLILPDDLEGFNKRINDTTANYGEVFNG
jgi:hypothetical protein